MANFLVFDAASLASTKTLMSTTGLGAATDDAVSLSTKLACEKVEKLCGPVLLATRTERVQPGAVGILRAHDATLVAITTKSGTVLDVADFDIDDQLLTRVDETAWTERLTVEYSAGWVRAEIPAWATGAALLIALQHRRGQMTTSPGSPVPTGSGFLIPNQAKELMEDHLLAPDGFA